MIPKSSASMSLLLLTMTLFACDDLRADGFAAHRDLLPASTQAVFEVIDAPRFEQRWNNTFLGALANEPQLKPFVESQRKAIRDQMLELGFAINLTLKDLQDIASGEVAISWMQFKSSTGVALMVDTRGREAATAKLFQRIDADLKGKRSATLKNEAYRDAKISVYTLKRKLGQINVEQFVYTIVDGRLIASDSVAVVKSILDLAEAKTRPLPNAVDYKTVFQKTGSGDDSDIRWFIRPLGFARVLETRGGGLRKQQLDTIKLLQQQGFDAIIAAGGHLLLDASEQYDVTHRAFVLAPPVVKEASKYKLAARMLQFPNLPPNDPPAWVLPKIATYLDANWLMDEAFWASETLINQIVGDKIFRPTLDGIKKDKDGPQIDIATDIIANLDDRLILLTDNVQPVSPQSERMLVGVQLKNPAQVKAAIDKMMDKDPQAFKIEYPHHKWIWQVRNASNEAGDDDLEDLEGFEDFKEFEIESEEGNGQGGNPPLLNQWAITVYDGFLLFSSHAEMLVETIDHHRDAAKQPAFKDDPDFKRAKQAIDAETKGTRAIWRVLQTQRSLRAKYDLFRKGQLRDSDSVLAAIIRRILENSKAKKPDKKVQINAGLLPNFNAIRKYLHPAGLAIKTEPNGWSVMGMLLREPKAKPE